MARYNEVHETVWSSDDFATLSAPEPNAQTLWLWILTHRKTPLPGIYSAGLGYCMDYLKWDRESLVNCFQELEDRNMALCDWKKNVIYLPSWKIYHRPQNPNVLKSWMSCLDVIPRCELKDRYTHDLQELVESLGLSFSKAFKERYTVVSTPEPAPLPNPKPKPKPEPKISVPLSPVISDDNNGNAKDLLSWFGQMYLAVIGTEYHANFGKDGSLLKGLNEHYGTEYCKNVITYFFDGFIRNNKYALSNPSVAKLKEMWSGVVAEMNGVESQHRSDSNIIDVLNEDLE